MTREEAIQLVHQIFDAKENMNQGQAADAEATPPVIEEPRKTPENQRVVRTKTSGDRVYLIDEVKKTRQWLTNPDVLEKAGFTAADVVEITDEEALKYQTGPAIYRVDS